MTEPAPADVTGAEGAEVYDPSVPAGSAETYDPSMPVDADEAAETYDPSMPADAEAEETYDPSVPAGENVEHYDPSVPAGGGYDPSVPAGGDYDPSRPAEGEYDAEGEGDYDPSRPAEGGYSDEERPYDPSRPADGDYDRPDEEEASYDPSMPAGGGYDPPAPVESGEEMEEGYGPSGQVEGQYDAPPQMEYDAETEAEATPSNGTPMPMPMPDIPADTNDQPKVDLPEGLTGDSPSVANNHDLVRQWRHDPSDQALLLWLFNWAVDRSEVEDARAWYAALAVDNPTASGPLLSLINLELALSHFKEVEDLFSKALNSAGTLMAAADINIWKAYLHYIRRQNPADGPDPEATRSTVTQAYEYALKECGVDRESGEIWQEYISYLGENKTRNPWEQQQNADNMRKIFQRAVAIPLNNVEALWKNYDAFESAQNKVTAKKFLADRSPAYMTARTALRECRQRTDTLPRPELPPFPNFSDGERRVVGAWRNYIKWEESNPLQSDDPSLVVQRTDYALRKCMAQMRHFPELWHYAATYHLNAGRADEGVAFLRAGVAACPKSFLLAFALVELEEDRKNYADCHSIFEGLISGVSTEIEELQDNVAAEVERARGPEIPVHAGLDSEESDVARMVRERDERGKRVTERRGRDIEAAKTAAGTAWVMYMRFARRSEGLKSARLVFGKGRKSPHITWHVFQASALMEYHSNKDSGVAVRIFELGIRQFADEVPFVIGYLEFLLSINDDTNARALFERSALKIAPALARPLWETWARFEYMHGDLAAVHKLEARWAEAFPSDSPLKRFAQRHTYAGVDEIALRDLGLRARQGGAGPAAAPHTAAPPAAPAPGPALRGRAIPPHMARPPVPPFPPRTASPIPPSSPAKRDRSPPRSPRPDIKRARPASPPRRFAPVGGHSPVPPPRGRGPQPPPGSERDRSGLPTALSWFVGTLPPTRQFDGPIFRPDDIMGLFSNISPAGLGVGIGVGAGAAAPRPPMPPARPPARFAPGRRF
ncbi:uncharacterized protein CcaverHIS019_0408390 [Cutaneotrichosporon cavernicola]|uniref:mRNA 3'-end-processing protein RNA14 n=1 Tax=Cutaneotrichosporon cavernicola TaxID=279322 RepID=A0AA48L4V4_9TREE|nr:uncharacterized protein CcaverHIS019_0408390 [Cutaneotrichosporon cavernicola]BEI92019.1 hypothetical protein CcaverHIS019_0408390 [Cutaneotrichosporon cavernicola]BEI99789.1 hypothetical protein CcaverHIS631_0408320 [Cutaneotrichosporon cavernicola]BEJ07565.1 hypothetical protein CcaverHIS641_0408340 [Cutaneotrichosporon cavernicola]